jgi:hypothetical protein
VIDHVQELPRLSAGGIELLLNLPEVLQWGSQIAIVFISRIRLSSLGLHPLREPPAVPFKQYSKDEAGEALRKTLSIEFPCAINTEKDLPATSLSPDDVTNGVMEFAWPHLGRNLRQLLSVARQLLRDTFPSDLKGGWNGADFQQRVLQAVQQRLGICDLSGLLPNGENIDGLDSATISAHVTLRQMTKAEMRLVLSAYLAGYVEKEDDAQLFMPGYKRRVRRKTSTKQQDAGELPVYVRAPQTTSLSRLLAIYHRLARRPHLLGPPLFEHLAGLREAGLLRFTVERACSDSDLKVTCRAQLPLVRAITGVLGIDLAEYLTKY